MAVAFDAASESHTGTAGSVSEASFTWNHTPVGTPKGVTVFTFVNANADNAESVTYGGVSLTAVTGGRATDTATEPGDCKAWHLGASIPTGVQAVVVNRTNNANEMYAISITVTGASNTEPAPTPVLLQGDGTLAEQSVDDGSPGTSSLRLAGINSGISTGAPTGANSTNAASIVFVSPRSAKVVYETVAGQGARSVGFTSGASDDRAGVHLAVREIAAGGVVGPLVAGRLINSRLVNGVLT